jgi:hypothetical protein
MGGKLYSIDFYRTSHCSKRYAILAGLVTIQTILQWYHIPVAGSMQIQIHRDNQIVVRKIQPRLGRRRTVNQFKIADVDVELQVMHTISELRRAGLRISIQQIQSRHTSKSKQFNHEERMHIKADVLAKKATGMTKVKQYHSFPINRVDLAVNHQTITSNYMATLSAAFNGHCIKKILW